MDSHLLLRRWRLTGTTALAPRQYLACFPTAALRRIVDTNKEILHGRHVGLTAQRYPRLNQFQQVGLRDSVETARIGRRACERLRCRRHMGEQC